MCVRRWRGGRVTGAPSSRTGHGKANTGRQESKGEVCVWQLDQVLGQSC